MARRPGDLSERSDNPHQARRPRFRRRAARWRHAGPHVAVSRRCHTCDGTPGEAPLPCDSTPR